MSTPPSHPDAERFRRWSEAFYARPGIAAACLDLQDRNGAEVNLLLLLLWLAEEGHAPLDAAAIDALRAAAAPWREEIVLPLRRLRRALKGQGEETVRRAIAVAELEAEFATQRRLIAALPPLAETDAAPEMAAAYSLDAHGGLAPAGRTALIEGLVRPQST